MGWNDIIMDRLSRSMIVIIRMRERRSWRRKRVPVVNPRDVLLIRCVLFFSFCLYNLLSKTGNWEYYLASLNILPLFPLFSSLLVLERDKIYVWKNEKRTRVEKSSSISLETKGTKSGKRGKRRGRFPALNSRSSATTKLSAITIMIIITRTMMTTRRTMIRSFSLLLLLVSRRGAWQLVGARTSIQLILYLPNYTILFLIGRRWFDHPNGKKRNLTWPILLFTPFRQPFRYSFPYFFKMFYQGIREKKKKKKKNKFDFFDGQFVYTWIEFLFLFLHEIRSGDKNCPIRFEEFRD